MNEISSLINLSKLIFDHRHKYTVLIKKPWVLISQIQRSGGTLLSQLLDGHHQLYVHPSELRIGYPTKDRYPAIDLTESPGGIFDKLSEAKAINMHIKDGYSKYSPGMENLSDQPTYPFIFSIELQKSLFISLFNQVKPISQRQVLDCYTTAYFNAWIDYQGLYRDPISVKYCAAFIARLACDVSNIDKFFNDYPDGKILTIVRDPISWFASARKHLPNVYRNLNESVTLWKQSASSSLNIIEKYPNKAKLLIFEELLMQPQKIMKMVSDFVGIEFTNTLLIPSFNGMMIKANSSFQAKSFGINKEPFDRRSYLESKEIEDISINCSELYNKAVSVSKSS
jgi:hypothetical protein